MNLHREERYGIRESKCSSVSLLLLYNFSASLCVSSSRPILEGGRPTRLYDAAGATDGSAK